MNIGSGATGPLPTWAAPSGAGRRKWHRAAASSFLTPTAACAPRPAPGVACTSPPAASASSAGSRGTPTGAAPESGRQTSGSDRSDPNHAFLVCGPQLEWGFVLASYSGTYRIQPDGRMSVRLNHFDKGWPDMILERDATSLLLGLAKDDVGFCGFRKFWPVFSGNSGRFVSVIAV
jgi:hypothetical protein